MFITNDGEFEPAPPIEFDAKGRPSLRGMLRVPVDPARQESISKRPQTLKVLGRSGHAQVGLELEHDTGKEIIIQNGSIDVPIVMRALGSVREPWLDTILDLYAKGRCVKAGRVLALGDSKHFSKADVEALIADDLIAIEGDFSVNADGSVRVYLDRSLFAHDVLEFAEAATREQILVHSRMAIQKYQDHTTTDSFLLKAQSLAVTGIRFSSGPFAALVRPELTDNVRHIKSGVFLDGFRSTRIDQRYGQSGVRQIELFNDSDRDRIMGPKDYVDIEILPQPQARSDLGVFTRKASRSFYHRHGVPLSGVINLEKASVQKALFDKIGPSATAATYYARVITPNGLTNIGWATSPKFQHAKTEKGIESVLATRDPAAAMMPVSHALKNSVDHGRVFVSHMLPAANDLYWLYELGIRAFIFKEMAEQAGAAHQFPNVFMSGHLHETIHLLSLEGVAFSQVFETASPSGAPSGVRDFFKGFWCLPESKVRSERVTTIFNMYGWHKSNLLVHCEAEIEDMFRRVGALVGMETVGVMHGKGPGFMLLADEVARKLGLLSMGVGLDVEKVGQFPNFLPDFALDFLSYERAYRQKLMDQLGLIKIFNLGGYGTLEELAITICSYKLFESVPAPIILVDESLTKKVSTRGDTDQNFWGQLHEQINTICNTTQLKYRSGETVDLTNTPFGLPWMVNVMHCAPTYRAAAEIVERFVRDPLGYWRAAGLTEMELQMAVRSYRQRLEYYGFKLPAFLDNLSMGVAASRRAG